jgi:hypothetical protein
MLVAIYNPLQAPGGAPNYFMTDADALYERLIWWVAAASPLLLLSACSDDDTPAPAATSQVSSGASQSSAGLVAYVQALAAETAAGTADDKEPVDLSTFAPPTPDEPEPVS